MKARLTILVAIAVIMLMGCGFKYDSYEAFKGADQPERISEITNILDKGGAKGYDKFCLIYIDHMITTVDFYLTLEEQFPDPKFEDFLNNAVLTLYYAYNSDNLKLAPEKWENESIEFLISYHDYVFGYGEEKFRDYLKELVSDYNTWAFAFYNDTNISEWVRGDNYNIIHINLMEKAWRYGEFTFYDFKKLDTSDQSLVFRRMAWRNMHNNDKFDDESADDLDDWQNRWVNVGPDLLNTESFVDMSDDTPFVDVFALVLETLY